ncbi:MAG: glycosyltransferase [Nocardioidaceae bacterium]
MKVTTVLVSHDGARWLPAVIGGLDAQTVTPDRVLVVDTGSTDDSLIRLRATGHEVITAPATTTYPQAVALALASLPPADPDEWIWLLHDDSNPDPECLQHLTSAAREAGPEYAAIGPKIREWPSLRRLLEVGVTITGTGQRETHLLPGEFDQGQHDNIHPSLAANTAGLLIRRSALDDLPMDPNLPIFYTDVDLGWRMAKAGLGTVIEPRALVFHAEAARRGLRDVHAVRHPRALAREAAVYTMLVNCAAWAVPLRALRLLVGGLLRVAGLLLVRAVDDAIDEFMGLARGLGRLRSVAAGRKARKAEPRGHDARPLLAPWWLPYAHGGDFVSDIWSGFVDFVRGVVTDEQHESSLWKRILTCPSSWALAITIIGAIIFNHTWLTSGNLRGGALLASPQDASYWWQLWGAGWHWLGNGTTSPAAPYVGLLAFGSLFAIGSANALITSIFALAVPLSALGALVFAHRLLTSPWSRFFLIGSYALLPVVTGAVSQGRLGTVVALIVIPWAGLSALRLSSDKREVRVRAAWRTALAFSVVVAFVPLAWVFGALLIGVSSWLSGHRLRPSVWVPILAVPLLFALPWLAQTLTSAQVWLFEAGRPDAFSDISGSSSWHLVIIGMLLVAAALAGLRAETRDAVIRCWLVISAAAVTSLFSLLVVTLPGVWVTVRPWSGFAVAMICTGALLALALASNGALRGAPQELRGRRLVTSMGALAAIIVPALGFGWWAANAHDGSVVSAKSTQLPAYIQSLAQAGNTNAVLVLTKGAEGQPVGAQVLRRGELWVGDDSVLATTKVDEGIARAVSRLIADPDDRFAAVLANRGIRYVYAPRPVSDVVRGAVDAAPGLVSASEPRPGTRAWQVLISDSAPNGSGGGPLHGILLTLQVLLCLVILVQVMPSSRKAGWVRA